jgi:hypothetical protein
MKSNDDRPILITILLLLCCVGYGILAGVVFNGASPTPSPTPNAYDRWLYRSDWCFDHPKVASCPQRPTFWPSPPPTP